MDNASVAKQHYENFPVASLLSPAPLRPAVMALYRFARSADDLADEGDCHRRQRSADLWTYRADLQAVLDGRPDSGRWPAVFPSLAHAICQHALPPQWLHALLDAFEQDVLQSALCRPRPAAGLLCALGQPGRPAAAAPVPRRRRAVAAPVGRHLLGACS